MLIYVTCFTLEFLHSDIPTQRLGALMRYLIGFAAASLVFALVSFGMADDLASPAGVPSTTAVERSEASLQIEVDRLGVELDSAISQWGSKHPNVVSLRSRLSAATESMLKMKQRNAKLAAAKNSKAASAIDARTVIKLQQSMLALSDRVLQLEKEVRSLRAAIDK